MNYLQHTYQWFNNLSFNRKITLSIGILTIVFGTLLISWWVLSPTYAVLFKQIDEQDTAQILSQLEQGNIRYQLRNDGKDILIDRDLIAQTRLKLMGSGMQLKGTVGFELFDKSDFGMTDFSQKINYQRALQGELERTISSFDEIRSARVHLVIPEHHLFDKDVNQPKAAITLNLKHSLTANQVSSIQQLITASVPNLKSNNVIVVDQNGNTLSASESDSTSNHFMAKTNIEHYLNNKVLEILHRVFPSNQIMVKVDVVMNYDELEHELVKPQSQGLITHEKEIRHSLSDKKEKKNINQNITLEKSYQFGSKKELFKRANGTIERLSISVVVPKDTDAQTIAQLQRLVKSTVGFSEQRGDVINIEALITTLPEPSALTPPTPETEINSPFTRNMHFYFLTVLIVMSSLGLIILNRIRMKKRHLLLVELTHWLTQHE